MELAAIDETLAPLIDINGNEDKMVETIRDFLIAAFNNREEMSETDARKLADEIFDKASYTMIYLAGTNERIRFSNDMKRFFSDRHDASPYLEKDREHYPPLIEARAEENFTALDQLARGHKKEAEPVLANWEILDRYGREQIICLMYEKAISDFINIFAEASVEPGEHYEFAQFFDLGEEIIKALVELNRVKITDVKLVSVIFIDKAREFFQERYNALVVKVVTSDIQ